MPNDSMSISTQTAEVSNQLDMLNKSVQTTVNETSSVFLSLGTSISSALGTVLDGIILKFDLLVNHAGTMKDILTKLWDSSQAITFTDVIMGIVTALEALAATVTIATAASKLFSANLVISKISLIAVTAATIAQKVATTAMSAAQTALNFIMNMNPLVLIATLIAGLVTALILLWNNCEGFREALTTFFDTIKAIFSPILDSVVFFLTEIIPSAVQFLIDCFASYIEFWMGLWEQVGQFFSACWDAIVAFFTETIPQVIQSVIAWFAELPAKIGEFLNNVVQFFSELPGKIWEFLTTVVENIISWITNLVSTAQTEIPKFISSIVTFISELPGKIWEFLVNIVSSIGEWVSTLIGKASEVLPGFISAVVTFFTELPGKIWSFLTSVVTSIATWASGLIDKAGEVIPGVITSIVNFFKDLPTKIFNIGKNLVSGLWNGITGSISWLYDNIKSWCGGIIDHVKSFFGIQSPSTLMRDQIGLNLALGVAEGFSKGNTEIVGAFSDTLDALEQKAERSKNDLYSTYADLEYPVEDDVLPRSTGEIIEEDIKPSLLDRVKSIFDSAGKSIPEGFFTIGDQSAEQFGKGFEERLHQIFLDLQAKISTFNNSMVADITAGAELAASKANSIVNNTTNNTTHNYHLTAAANSPKATADAIKNQLTLTRMLYA